MFVFRFGEFEVREREFLLVKAGQALPVAPTAFRVLLLLLKNSGKVVSKEEILSAVWNDCSVSDNSLTRSIADLRRLMGDDSRDPQYIATVQTVGYRFLCPVEVCEDPSPGEKAPNATKMLIDTASVAVPSNAPGATTAAYSTAKLEVRATGQAATERRSHGQGWRSRRLFWSILAACAGCALLAVFLIVLLKPTGPRVGNYKYTPIANDADNGVWSPDGKAVAYQGPVNGTSQVFLRYLNAAAPIQLTHEPHDVWLWGWSSDRNHLIIGEDLGLKRKGSNFYSIPLVGGEPEFIADLTFWGYGVLSPDGRVFAALMLGEDNKYSVKVSDPLGSPLRAYTPAPFASKVIGSLAWLRFSPDGKRILLIFDGENSKQSVWIMSYPPGGNPPPHVIEKRPSFGTYLFGASWMPDGRHIVVSLIGYQNSSTHLWMADTESSDLTPLTSGGSNEQFPAVAPDGKRVLFTQHNYFLNVTSLSIKDGSATTLISTGRSESMADWSANQPKLVWVSNRSGPYDIWVRQPDGVERPVITAADFPPGTCRVLLNPVLSPDGDRIVYQMLDSSGANRLWISSLSGGVPVRLTNMEPLAEFAGSWSPDGRRFVYLQVAGGEWQLMIVKTSGSAAPTLLKDMGPDSPDVSDLPDWSPTGSWITYHGGNGWHLISPDGKSSKSLGKIRTPYLSFAKDGKLLYGIQAGGPGSDQNRATFFSLDPITLKQKVIKELGKDYVPPISFRPSVRFSLSSDGKSLVYSTGKENWDLWMLEGLAQPSWVDRIRSWAGK